MIKIKEKISELLEISVNKLDDDKEVKALHFNSFALIEMVEWIEDEYKVRINIETFKKFRNLKDLFKYVENNLHK